MYFFHKTCKYLLTEQTVDRLVGVEIGGSFDLLIVCLSPKLQSSDSKAVCLSVRPSIPPTVDETVCPSHHTPSDARTEKKKFTLCAVLVHNL